MSRYLFYVARFLMALIFIVSGYGKLTHFSGTESMLASQGIPLAPVVSVIVIVMEGGGLLAFYTREPR